MISTFTAFIDANVFYGARLRSLALFLAQTKLFRARWSKDVHNEWIENLLKNRPDLNRNDLDRTRHLMDQSVPDCLVNGYEPLIERFTLPDPRDRHILAAAIVAHASVVVTFNLSDFPADTLSTHGLHAKHPDEFILDIADIHRESFLNAVSEEWTHYKKPTLSLDDYADSLRAAGVPNTADLILKHRVILAE
ncbi:MAG: PIN domain-containing protein [Ancalomicrobiaceae bacterium]|nr:PIN domain-containing protein [Ancalomicrobiaceae bacterium]